MQPALEMSLTVHVMGPGPVSFCLFFCTGFDAGSHWISFFLGLMIQSWSLGSLGSCIQSYMLKKKTVDQRKTNFDGVT
jgi:hypothetical protein